MNEAVRRKLWEDYSRLKTPEIREKIILECTECKNRNYNTTKNKANDPERLEIKKYCPTCKKTTAHKETK